MLGWRESSTLRSPPEQACVFGETCIAIATDQGLVANFQNNARLIEWVNAQPLSNPVTCLGDGHDGVWNIVQQVATAEQRQEILDWYHLKENLHFCWRFAKSARPGRSFAHG